MSTDYCRFGRSHLALLLVLLAGCAPRTPPAPPGPQAAQTPFAVHATLRELMDAEVDPAADGIWDAVASILTVKGEVQRQPHTAAQWQALRRSALTLIESTNLLVMPGRRIAAPDTAAVAGELSPAQAQQRLEARRAEFLGYALGLRAVSLQALAAIDARDPARLFEVGIQLDAACEACHLVFWYPPQAGP